MAAEPVSVTEKGLPASAGSTLQETLSSQVEKGPGLLILISYAGAEMARQGFADCRWRAVALPPQTTESWGQCAVRQPGPGCSRPRGLADVWPWSVSRCPGGAVSAQSVAPACGPRVGRRGRAGAEGHCLPTSQPECLSSQPVPLAGTSALPSLPAPTASGGPSGRGVAWVNLGSARRALHG